MRNLKSLNGRGLQPLGSLERMEIHNCPQLQSFSVEGLPTSLLELEIRGCPLLKPRCRRKEGEDWPKISHIPLILRKKYPKSLAFDNFQLQAGHAYGAGPSSFGTMNFATPPVTPQTTVKPLVLGTPPVSRNVEQYPQLTSGSQLYPGTGNPIYLTGPRVGGSLSSIPSHLGDLSQRRPVIMTLMRLFNETSEALGGLCANPVKKREIEDNSRKIGALFAKLNSGDISKNASEKACSALSVSGQRWFRYCPSNPGATYH
ncbi:hypothetical protein C3L33_03824, partial [Rhododendron williamsianum]